MFVCFSRRVQLTKARQKMFRAANLQKWSRPNSPCIQCHRKPPHLILAWAPSCLHRICRVIVVTLTPASPGPWVPNLCCPVSVPHLLLLSRLAPLSISNSLCITRRAPSSTNPSACSRSPSNLFCLLLWHYRYSPPWILHHQASRWVAEFWSDRS